MRLDIDVISDVVCPWCFVGEHNLKRALHERPELEVSLRFRPYLLHPHVPEEGIDSRTLMRSKFGSDSPKVFRRVEQVAREAGLELRFDLVKRVPDTTAAHCLIDWASAEGKGEAVAVALFGAYFQQGLDLGSYEVLADIAESCGLAREAVFQRLEAREDRERIRAEADANREEGVTGVPFFRVGKKFFIPGAQDPKTILKVLDKAVAKGLASEG